MGRRHREKRAHVKSILRANGLYENEFGEIKKRITKAEARAQILRRAAVERALVAEMTRKAVEEIQAEEDRRVFAMLDAASIPAP